MGYDFCAVPPWDLGPPTSLRNYVVEKGPGDRRRERDNHSTWGERDY